MLVGHAGSAERRGYRLFLAKIHLHLSGNGERVRAACPPIEAYAGPSNAIPSPLLTCPVAPPTREQICGVVQYVRTGTPSCGGNGSERAAEPGCGKRKARHTLDGVLTEREINAWLKDVGGDDAMLEELLSVESLDGSDSGATAGSL